MNKDTTNKSEGPEGFEGGLSAGRLRAREARGASRSVGEVQARSSLCAWGRSIVFRAWSMRGRAMAKVRASATA